MRRPILLPAITLLLPSLLSAQLELPVRLELNGATDADRQVMGLGDPLQPDAAVSVDAARSHVLTTATTTGTAVLSGTLQPAPATIIPGMLVTIVPQEANSAGAQLDLNGNGPHPLVKWGSVPVDSADLPVGVPSRLLFDGTSYQVLNWNSRPCATRTMPGSPLYCIDDSVRGSAVSYYDAVIDCHGRGGRLCSFGEWASACRRNAGFLGTLVSYEWVDDAANSGNHGKVVGSGYYNASTPEVGTACEYGSTHQPLTLNLYRCCYDR